MRYVNDGSGYSFAICDFCDIDASGGQEVHALGEKGICNRCLSTLKNLIKGV